MIVRCSSSASSSWFVNPVVVTSTTKRVVLDGVELMDERLPIITSAMIMRHTSQCPASVTNTYKHGSWIGTTHDDIKETIDGHICRVVQEYADGKGKSKSSPSKSSTNSSEGKVENWSKPFAEHFARHCKPKIGFKSVTEKEIRKFCRANIKIEVLRRQDGTDLMWECEEE